MKRQERGFLNHEPDDEEQQQTALEQCEAALFGGLRRQLEAGALVGAQLSTIRERELYRVAKCDSLEMYCRKYLELARDQVRRYLDVHEVVGTLRAANLELPVNEAQARMLTKIPRTRLIACWRTVLELCAREEIALSDRVVRRAVQFEIARENQMSSSEGVTAKRAGVRVTLEC